MKSIFTDKTLTPTSADLEKSPRSHLSHLAGSGKIYHGDGAIYPCRMELFRRKFGWSYRIKDKKRVLIYLLPRDGYFKAAFVFGQKAMDQIMASTVSDVIKNELVSAKPYAEGRGIRIDVNDRSGFENLRLLIQIKIAN